MKIINKMVKYERKQLGEFDPRILNIMENLMIHLYREGRNYAVIPTSDPCMSPFRELAEFLDGNGFEVEYESNVVRIYFNPIFGKYVDELKKDDD